MLGVGVGVELMVDGREEDPGFKVAAKFVEVGLMVGVSIDVGLTVVDMVDTDMES